MDSSESENEQAEFLPPLKWSLWWACHLLCSLQGQHSPSISLLRVHMCHLWELFLPHRNGIFFFFSSNYLDDPCPNLVYLAAETDLDESQHLVPLSSLSQSPSPMGWKVVVTNTHWICSFLQMLRGISHDIMDFDYNHRNAGITRTRPDHKAACSSFPSPNAL